MLFCQSRNYDAKHNVLVREDKIESILGQDKKNRGPETLAKPAVKTKSEMLRNQAHSIVKIGDCYATCRQNQDAFVKHRWELLWLEKREQSLVLELLSKHEFDAKARGLLFD